MNLWEQIKNQNTKKIFIIIYNLIRIIIIKLINPKSFQSSLIQNINPSTEIVVEGNLRLSHSIFTRRNVTFRVEGGTLEIGTSFFNQGCCVTCLQSIKIGNGCLFGPNVVIVDHDHVFKNDEIGKNKKYSCSDVVIGDNTWIGANCVILRGTIIGNNCVIGAGTIVKGKFPDNTKIIRKQIIQYSKIE